MQTQHDWSRRDVCIWRLAGCLLLLLIGGSVLGLESRAQEGRREGPGGRVRVTVDQGRLSVDLSQADMHTVLAQIGVQAGVAVSIGPIERRTVSTRFSGVDLPQGLQRLLRLAALNYVILYRRGPTGAVVMQEVRVFGEEKGGTTVASSMAQRDGAVAEADAAQRFAAALAQAASSPTPAESAAADGFREALERAGAPTPAPEESDAARRFREALEQAQQRGAGPGLHQGLPPGQQEQSEGTRNNAGPTPTK